MIVLYLWIDPLPYFPPSRPITILGNMVKGLYTDVLNCLHSVHLIIIILLYKFFRDGCDLDDLPSEDSDLSPLPSHFLPPMPTVQALYGLDPQKIKGNQQHLDCLQSHIALMRFTNFVLGYIRLTLACIEIHKGMLNAVSWIFTDATFQGYLRKALVPVIECREVDHGYSGTSNRGPSKKRTTSQQRTLIWAPGTIALVHFNLTTSLQRTKWLIPKNPLPGGSTVYFKWRRASTKIIIFLFF